MECVAFVTRSIESRIFSTVFMIFFFARTRRWCDDPEQRLLFSVALGLFFSSRSVDNERRFAWGFFLDGLPKYVVDVWMNKYCFITQRTRNFHKPTQFEMRWSCVGFWCARRRFFWLDFNSLLRQRLLRSQWLCSIKRSSSFCGRDKEHKLVKHKTFFLLSCSFLTRFFFISPPWGDSTIIHFFFFCAARLKTLRKLLFSPK